VIALACGWIGATIMVIASFNMRKPLGLKMAILALLLLSIQAYSNATYNLLALNLCSVLGFALSLYKGDEK
jgi:hypothetical protein|tara:strand:- start:2010 stop:2222 length:213 start_codon:yes stop_codon:yes gene_type:complete